MAEGRRAVAQEKMAAEVLALRREVQGLRGANQQLDRRARTDTGFASDLTYFNGDFGESFEDFFEHFELIARGKRWAEEDKLVILPAYLRGRALLEYRFSGLATKK